MNVERGGASIGSETTEKPRQTPYKLPEKFADATVHFLYGLSEPTKPGSVLGYLRLQDKKYAFIADLIAEGLTPEQIEQAVNSGDVKTAPVFNSRVTDLFWDPEAEGVLEELAVAAQANAGGDGTDPNAPIRADVVSLGGFFESQQIALVALAFAAHRGLVIETDIDRGMGVGNMFVSKDSPLARILVPQPADSQK